MRRPRGRRRTRREPGRVQREPKPKGRLMPAILNIKNKIKIMRFEARTKKKKKKKEEGRRKRKKKEEGRRKKEEGRRKKKKTTTNFNE